MLDRTFSPPARYVSKDVKACAGYRVEETCFLTTLSTAHILVTMRTHTTVFIRSPEGLLLHNIILPWDAVVEFPRGLPLRARSIISAFSVEKRHPKLYPNGKFFLFQPFFFTALVMNDANIDLFHHPV